MGSVKFLIRDDTPAGKLYVPPTAKEFGRGAWWVTGNYSVKDLKEETGESEIENKPEALAMENGSFMEHLKEIHPDIPNCYLGMLGKGGKITDTKTLLQKGDVSNIVVMQLAHIPETFFEELQGRERLLAYRAALQSGELQCGVADVESIFRAGFPLGSSTFKNMFKACGMGKEYESIATYEQAVAGLDKMRALVAQVGLKSLPNLAEVLQESGLGTTIPNPGFLLKEMTYDSTTKFEKKGDRKITEEEARALSGLDDEGYDQWTQDYFPRIAQAQWDYGQSRGITTIDGKCECVAYRRKPVVTDFAFTVDENRKMIEIDRNGVTWAIPSNKEIARALWTAAGADTAIRQAKEMADKAGHPDEWRGYFKQAAKDCGIDIQAVNEQAVRLMSYAVSEIANRTLGQPVFDVPPLEQWVDEFMPYASKIVRQE